MTRKEYIDYCKKCELKSFDRDKGIICSITNEVANFEHKCSNFKQDEKYIEIIEDPNKNRPIVLSLVAAVLIGIVILFNLLKNNQIEVPKEKELSFYEVFTDEDCLEFASRIENSLIQKKPLFLNRALDYNYLVDYITFQRKMSKVSKQNFKAILKRSLKPGNLLISQLEPAGHFSFRKYYVKNNKPHLVFRFFNNQSILILDFELGLLRKKIVIKNAYNYVSGELWGESFYNRFNLSLKYKNRPHALKQAYEASVTANQLIDEGKFIEAQETFNKIPPEFNENSQSKLLEIKIAAGINEKKYIKLMDKYIQSKKEDERFVAFNNVLKYSTLGDAKNVLKNTEILNEHLNNDNILDFFIALTYNVKNDYTNAKKHISIFKEAYPTIFDGFLLDLDIELKQENIQNSIKIIEEILISFNINKEELNEFLNLYPALKKTPEYINFLNNF